MSPCPTAPCPARGCRTSGHVWFCAAANARVPERLGPCDKAGRLGEVLVPAPALLRDPELRSQRDRCLCRPPAKLAPFLRRPPQDPRRPGGHSRHSTSSLRTMRLGRATRRADRVVGLHLFDPVTVLPV